MIRNAADLDEFIQNSLDNTSTIPRETVVTQIEEYFEQGGSAVDLAEVVKRKMKCPVCLEILVDGCVTISCKHVFCSYCLHMWLIDNKSCPMCRCGLTGEPRRLEVVDRVVSLIMFAIDDDYWMRRIEDNSAHFASFHTKFQMNILSDNLKLLKKWEKMLQLDTVHDAKAVANKREPIRKLIEDYEKGLKMFPITKENMDEVMALVKKLSHRQREMWLAISSLFTETPRLHNNSISIT